MPVSCPAAGWLPWAPGALARPWLPSCLSWDLGRGNALEGASLRQPASQCAPFSRQLQLCWKLPSVAGPRGSAQRPSMSLLCAQQRSKGRGRVLEARREGSFAEHLFCLATPKKIFGLGSFLLFF